MASKDEALGPNMSVVLLTGLVTFLIGAVLGVASLVSQPVLMHASAPDPENLVPGEVIYVRGSRSGRTAWRGKEQAWKQRQVDRLILREAEINQWSEERLEMPTPEADEEDAGSWKDTFQITVEPVNFRILEDRVQLATEVAMPELFPSLEFHYQVFGHFESAPDGVVFVPEEGTLGRAPLGSLPVARDWLYNFVRKQFSSLDATDWLAESLQETESIEISDGRLVLQRKSRG
jgi:hypothetical protein